MKTKTIDFMGWKNCIEFQSGNFRIIATTEIGPRIIGGFVGDNPNNIFSVVKETAGTKGKKNEWNIFGGHRLWHSPEAKPRSYSDDTKQLDIKKTRSSILFSQKEPDLAGIHKSIEITPAKNDSFKITHRLVNKNLWDVEIAAWALSVMAPGGTGIFPMPQGDKKSVLPNTYLTLWPYNTMNDGRISIGSKYTIVRNDPNCKNAQKIGYNCEDGWIAYQNHGITFIKKFDHYTDAEYPDNGCSIECYTCSWMQEMETLSPLYILPPEGEITFTETWSAFELATKPVTCEAEASLVFG